MRGTLQGTDLKFRGVSTDTRTLREGELFFALQGPNFDGVAFVEAAAKQHASGAVVPAPVDAEIPVIVAQGNACELPHAVCGNIADTGQP